MERPGRAGSITKTFIATVLLQMEAEGRLSLDDSVGAWLPDMVRGYYVNGTGGLPCPAGSHQGTMPNPGGAPVGMQKTDLTTPE
ncbi:serine hydrolase [Streptomyces aureocirculatus]|uniref:serine hydrolase n=1 Tax=Streptomyces aureocirculatus TaxID=67275 RepID=UPI0004C931AA